MFDHLSSILKVQTIFLLDENLNILRTLVSIEEYYSFHGHVILLSIISRVMACKDIRQVMCFNW